MNEALGELRSALGGNNIDSIKTAHEKLAQVSQKAGTALYNQAQQSRAPGADAGASAGAAGAQPGPGAAGAQQGGPEDVVDAEIIDEDDKK
jgi:molecular chaperone DnaK